ncbi:MAG: hypothetical protein JWN04_2711 [Myxococcaceae bacterium]|nr:hypothetical protein [Myxococcaceae bacterium]
MMLFVCACGHDDPKPWPDAGSASPGAGTDAQIGGDARIEPHDAAPADSGPATDSGQAVDSGVPASGPPVTVSASGVPTLLFDSEFSICKIDAARDLVCRAHNQTAWVLKAQGPLLSAAIFDNFSCYLHADGTLTCLQINTRSAPTAPWCSSSNNPICINNGAPPAGTYVAVSVGAAFGCAITSAGQIVCWGDNGEAKATPPTGSDFVAIDTAGGLSCALHRTGEQACWGERFALKPDYTLPLPAVQVQVSGGSCALLQDGTLKCIGSTYPVPTLPALKYARIAMDGSLCGLTADGQIHCAGLDYVEKYTPPPGPYVEAAAGGDNICALRGDGVVDCWGRDWGNGAGPEVCSVQQSILSADGKMSTFLIDEPQWSVNAASKTSHFVASAELGVQSQSNYDSSPFFYALANGPASSTEQTAVQLASATSDTQVVQGLYSLDATLSARGSLVCIPQGSGSTLRRNGDELHVDLRQGTLLGACPGTPVAGSLNVCWSGQCNPQSTTGALDGVAWTSPPTHDSVGSTLGNALTFADGSFLRYANDTVRHSTPWGVLVTAPDGPFGGKIYCVSRLPDGSGTNIFSGFSSLGVCPSGGSHTLSGCVR